MSQNEPAQPTPPPSGPPAGFQLPPSTAAHKTLKITALLYEMFGALASLYKYQTQETLRTQNELMQFYASQQDIVANQLEKVNKLASNPATKDPGKYQGEIQQLKTRQDNLQTYIGQTQATTTAVASACSTMISMLNSINQLVYQAMTGTVQNM
jgi:hypothetical protein